LVLSSPHGYSPARRGRLVRAAGGILKIVVEVSGVAASEPFCKGVRRSLLFALSRFGTRVQSVAVRLSDVANPLGGVETLCQMEARLRSRGSVRVQVLDGGDALNRAAIRLSERVARLLVDGSSDDDIPPRATEPAIQLLGPASPASTHGRARRRAAATRRR
jgi:hypothetical protein